jgi:DNA-binding NtrC family response regulator
MKAILIVEDDITFGMMLKTWLGKKGFEVSSVSNIARARKHIESQTVDLVLSDLRLPDYEGIDLLKWMNDQGLDIPLIIMTGYSISGTGHETWCTGLYRKTCQPGRIIKENIRSSTNRENANSSFRSQDVFEKSLSRLIQRDNRNSSCLSGRRK